MAIPDYQTIMLPLLELIKDQNEQSGREANQGLGDFFKLTDDERKKLLPSGRQSMFENRLSWAKFYLKHAGLIEATRRGYFKITDLGKNALRQNPAKIDVDFLKQFPKFQSFIKATVKKDAEYVVEERKLQEHTPEEVFENAYQELLKDLVPELLDNVRKASPGFFEKTVIDLLVAMGYGGSPKDVVQFRGKSGDEGIDGVINQDRLGLDVIYIQAKKWKDDNIVGRPEIQKFAGALQGKRAKKGVFITTSGFSQEALRYVEQIENKIILIDGDYFAQLMIEHNVGVSKIVSRDIKKIDLDYFVDE